MSDRSSMQTCEQGFTPVHLGEIAHIEMGQSPDSRYVFEDSFLGYPFLQGNAEFGTVSPEPKYGCTRPAKTSESGDVLISVRAPVGAVNIADQSYCIGRGLAAIRVRGVEPSLAAHLIASQAAALRRVAQGTTFEAISKKDLMALKLRMPPLDELPVIAQVLNTLDTASRETEALIYKLKAVKQGLLHDLLTRGIDANGQLRPPQSEAPQLYKESPLGWIPKEWEAVELNQLIDPKRPVVYGILMPGYGHPGGVPVVKVKDIFDGKIHLNDLLLTSLQIDREYSRSRLKAGDLLFTIRGTVGRTAFVPPVLDSANITQDTARLAVTGTDARFLRAYLGMAVPSRFIATHTLGVAVQGINLRDVRRIPIARPSALEAKIIADEIQTQEQRLESESLKAAKLRLVKVGLMDDLLTGCVRVTPLLESVQQPAAKIVQQPVGQTGA